CRYHVYLVLEHICTRVLYIHTSQRRDSQLFLYSSCDRSASHTITSSIECRSCDKYVRSLLFYHFQDLSFCCLQVFIEIRVSTDDRCNDLCFIFKTCHKCSTRSYYFSYTDLC